MHANPFDPYGAIPGYEVEQRSGRWRARRRGVLTPAMVAFGCKGLVTAGTFGELVVQTTAEKVKEAMVTAAEHLVQQVADADRQRAEDAARRWPA